MSDSAPQTDRTDELVKSASPRKLPRPSTWRLPRMFRDMKSDPIGMLVRCVEEFGDAMGIRTGVLDLALLSHPDHAAHILKNNAKNYTKSLSYRELELVVGKGLLTSEDRLWRRQRRIAQPQFKRKQVARFAPLVADKTARMLERWRQLEESEESNEIDISREMIHLTLGIVGQAFFGTDLSEHIDRLGEAMNVCLPFVRKRTEALFAYPVWLPLPSHRRFRRAVGDMDQLVHELIAERQRHSRENAPRDLLSTMIFARDPETDETMQATQVRDEIVTFLFAGHETTAYALTWTFILLYQNPDAATRVRREVDEVLGARAPEPDDVPRLAYTRRVLLETMRLYPPAWLLERQALADDVVSGWRVPRNTLVMLSAFTIHRHPEFWDEPERFDPERFLPERIARRHKAAYFPFGAGQRQCIGEDFAMMEMVQIVAMIVRAFDVQLVPEHPIEIEAGITLRPRHGARARLRNR